ncbi:hypothetical protein C8Q74DRAFT_1396378 [Fomes fomentarius]|nr:hypothetical protein C8Q74DRAFT_1396378 [Fomes fomentarius]
MPTSAPLHTTLTARLVTLCITLILFGVLLWQVFMYVCTYKSDSRIFKAMVTAIFYFYMILNFGNQEVTSSSNLGTLSLRLPLVPATDINDRHPSLPIALLRVATLSKAMAYLYCRLAIGKSTLKAYLQLGAHVVTRCQMPLLALTVELVVHNTYSEWFHYNWLVSACFAITVAGDIIILIGLVTSLRKSRTGIKSTASFLSTTCLLVIGSSLAIHLRALISTVQNLLEGDELFIIPVSVVAAKIYAIAVLAVLNSRQTLAEKADRPLNTEWLGLSNLKSTAPHTEDHVEVGVRVLDHGSLLSAQHSRDQEKSMIQPNVAEGLLECVQE